MVRVCALDTDVDEVARTPVAVEVDELVGAGPALGPALAALALDEHLHRLADHGLVALERDAFLQRHEAIEPLLHHRLRELLLEPGRLRPGTGRSLPYGFTFCPRSVTSTTPSRASPCTSASTSPRGRDSCGPRTSGTMQNVHRLSHPTETLTHAWCFDPRRAGSALGNTSVNSRTSICGPSRSAVWISSSSEGSACVPRTMSTHGARRWISPWSFCARQPATTMRIRGLR